MVVVDNSGCGRARQLVGDRFKFVDWIENGENVGFGAAINQAFRAYPTRFLATLNDDARAAPDWLERLIQAVEQDPASGMAASRVGLSGSGGQLDSAGMLIALDGSSKQRGHGEPFEAFAEAAEVLLPSGSAALYRKEMLDEIGLFEDDYFLYCEDTDLGLRGRWAGWKCWYVPEAWVEHTYSKTAGRASPRKAYFVERNRLRTVIRNFPFSRVLLSFACALTRYLWHGISVMKGKGKAAEFTRQGHSPLALPLMVARAHWDCITRLPALLRQRRVIMAKRRITARQFNLLLREHRISLKRIAEL